jgi:rifampicin phosphotransferase
LSSSTQSSTSAQFIADPSSNLTPAEAGEKAVALKAAMRGELPAPPWFVVLPDAFFSAMSKSQRDEFLSSKEPAKVKYLAQRMQLSPRCFDELREAVDALVVSNPDAYVAVRVSASAEGDGRDIPPALYVRPDDVRARVIEAWQAAYTEELLYRRMESNPGKPLARRPPAIIVQQMAHSDVSGVAYGCDPATGRRGIVVIASVIGLGTGLTEPDNMADVFEMSRDNVIVRRAIAVKQTSHVLDQLEGSGVMERMIMPSRQGLASLTDSQVQTVADLAWRANALFNRPQEVEWTLEAGHIFLLQAKPVAGVRLLADPDATQIRWDRRKLTMSFPGVVSPLSFSVAKWLHRGACQELSRALGLSETQIRSRNDLFDNIVGRIEGHVYLNTTRLSELLKILPQPRWHRRQLADSLGLIQPPAQKTTRSDAPKTDDEVLHLDTAGTARMALRLRAQRKSYEEAQKAFEPRLEAVLQMADIKLDRLRPDELTAMLRAIQRDLVDAWDAPSANEALAAIAYDLLGQLTKNWFEDVLGELKRGLVRNLEDLPGTHAATEIANMARSAARVPVLVDALCSGESAAIDIEMSSEQCASLRESVQAYLDRFGDVSPEGLKIEAMTLRENPLPLLREVGALARKLDRADSMPNPALLPTRAVSPDEFASASRAEERVAGLLSTHTGRRMFFQYVLNLARRRMRDHELYRFDRIRVAAVVRDLLLEIGRRFYAVSVIDSPRHILYLELDEIFAYVEGTASTTDLRNLVAVRWREYAELSKRTEPPAETVVTCGLAYIGQDVG